MQRLQDHDLYVCIAAESPSPTQRFNCLDLISELFIVSHFR